MVRGTPLATPLAEPKLERMSLRTTPLYDRLKAENAVFGESYGLEHPLWFAPAGEKAEEDISFRRSNAFPHVARECAAVRERVGLMETSSYAKYEVTGAGAEAFLSRIMANRMPEQGRIVLTPMLNERGKLICVSRCTLSLKKGAAFPEKVN